MEEAAGILKYSQQIKPNYVSPQGRCVIFPQHDLPLYATLYHAEK